jgi:outer membrane protein assembly factor BamB
MELSGKGAPQTGDRVSTPRLLWRFRIGTSYGGAMPRCHGELIFAWDNDSCLIVVDAASGTVVERHPSAGRIAHNPVLIEGSTAFLYTTREGQSQSAICAYNCHERRIVWTQEGPGRIADLALGPGQVVVTTREGVITALDKQHGSERWTHRLRRLVWSPAVVCGEREVYLCADGKAAFGTPAYVDATEGYLLALDSANGDIRWMYCMGGEAHHPPILAGKRIYAGDSGSRDRHVYCLSTSPKTRLGERIWRYDLGGLANCGTVAGDAVYWGCYDDHLYALDAGNGALRWRFKARGPVANSGPPCVLGDWVFATASDGYLYGLDSRSGALRWKYFVSEDDIPQTGKAEPPCEVPKSKLQDDAEVEREEREWRASLNRDVSETAQEREEEEKDPSPPGLVVWNTERHIFLLADNGLLHCFEAPRVSV